MLEDGFDNGEAITSVVFKAVVVEVLGVANMYPKESHSCYRIFVKEQVESLRKEGIGVDVDYLRQRENLLRFTRGY